MAFGDRIQRIILRAKDETRGAFASVQKRLTGLAATVRSVASGFGLAFGAGSVASLGAVAAGVKTVANDLDRLAKTSRSLNTTVEALSELQFAIDKTTQLTEQQFVTALQRMVRRIGAAAAGSKELNAVFEQLNLNVGKLADERSDQAFLDIVSALSKLGNEYEKANLAQKIFDDGWRGVLEAVDAGPAAFDRLINQARKIGTPTTKAAEAAEEFNDSMAVLNDTLKAFAYDSAPPVINAARDLLNFFGYFGSSSIPQLERQATILDEKIDGLTKRIRTLSIVPWRNEGKDIERLNTLKEELNDVYKQLDKLREDDINSVEKHADNVDDIQKKLTDAVAGNLDNRVKTYDDYLNDLKRIMKEQEDLENRIAKAGTKAIDPVDQAQIGDKLDAGDLFLRVKEGLAAIDSGDVDKARNTIENVTAAMDELQKRGEANIMTFKQLRENLLIIAKGIKEVEQQGVIDSAAAQEQAAEAAKKIENDVKPRIRLELDPSSVEEIKNAANAAMQGFSVPVTITPVVPAGAAGPTAAGIVPWAGSEGEPVYGDLASAEGHRTP